MKGSPDRSVAIADLVGEIGTVHGKGSGEVLDAPTGDTGGCVGRFGNETFLAPQLITQAAHVKVDRATGVVRVLKVAAAHDSGRIINRAGADGQVLGGVVMGVGLALFEGTMLDDQGRQRNPHLLDYKLLTCSDAPEIEVDWIEYDSVGPRGTKGVGEPPQVPTAGAIANAIAKVIGRARAATAHDTGACLGGIRRDLRMTRSFVSPRRSRRRCRRCPAGRDRSREGRTWSSVRDRGRRRCPTRSSRSTGSPGSARSTQPTAGSGSARS